MLRFVLVTLAISAMYVGLQQVWLSLSSVAELIESRAESEWPREAAGIAAAARDPDRRLPAEWHAAAFRLGYHVGYVTELAGSVAFSGTQIQNTVRDFNAPREKAAADLAAAMGVGPARPLPVSTADEFARIEQRIEQDELGLADQVEKKASARHRHLLLLGMHVGVTAAAAESTAGQIFEPKRRFIGHHAVLAAVAPAAWEPAARMPDGAEPKDRMANYVAAVATLDRAIAELPPLP